MAPHVLGVGYSYDEYGITAAEWRKYGIEFDYVDDIGQAAAMLSFKEYLCVAICTDIIPQEDLDALRKVRPVPIVVAPPSYSEAQRLPALFLGVRVQRLWVLPLTSLLYPLWWLIRQTVRRNPSRLMCWHKPSGTVWISTVPASSM